MTDQGEQSLRQLKHAATALNIERNAVALVLEHGLESVTVDMICAGAGVSQRTFFNYFKTKEAAILGAAPPKLDERVVREFLASDNPDLLGDLMRLLISIAPVDTTQRELAGARMRIMTTTPSLMHKEFERLVAMRDEVEEILFLRMRRSAPAGETAQQTRDQAAFVSHLMAGVLRYTAERFGPPQTGDPVDHVRELLTSVMPRLLGPT